MKGKKPLYGEFCNCSCQNFVVIRSFSPKSVRFQNGCYLVAIELHVVQFWSEIILVISNRTRAKRSFDFEITPMISDYKLHSTQFNYHYIQLGGAP